MGKNPSSCAQGKHPWSVHTAPCPCPALQRQYRQLPESTLNTQCSGLSGGQAEQKQAESQNRTVHMVFCHVQPAQACITTDARRPPVWTPSSSRRRLGYPGMSAVAMVRETSVEHPEVLPCCFRVTKTAWLWLSTCRLQNSKGANTEGRTMWDATLQELSS